MFMVWPASEQLFIGGGSGPSSRLPRCEWSEAVNAWLETRGIVLRADGASVTMMRGSTMLMTPTEASRHLRGSDLALWLVGFSWRPLGGTPKLRCLRRLQDGLGEWEDARASYLLLWRDSRSLHRRQFPEGHQKQPELGP